MKLITQNKKARFDYEVLDTIQAGIVLTGDEVKSIRAGHINLTGSFATITKNELFLLNCHITPYDKAYIKDEEGASRTRKLLVHRRELNKLIGQVSQKGITLVPLKLYFNPNSKVKVEIGLCKHKKAAGKKQEIKERDIKRETSRELKGLKRY
ncbi:MAG: SsrA-binding protein SmpB [Proteobacteria bacterium]|nr:SsrA-binding protein SmpB [Pseudomonadota bacterium]NBP15262.1 SsrA-binding protein SmpB [bacterium]